MSYNCAMARGDVAKAIFIYHYRCAMARGDVAKAIFIYHYHCVMAKEYIITYIEWEPIVFILEVVVMQRIMRLIGTLWILKPYSG